MPYPSDRLYPSFYPGERPVLPPIPTPRKRVPDLPPWRYFATRLNGDGTEDRIADELPISGLQFTRALSAPGGLQGTISPEMRRLTGDDGKPVFSPRNTAIYAEADGHPRYGAVLTNMPAKGHELGLTCTGFTAMPAGEPYNGIRSRIQVDPMDEYRFLWNYFQNQRGKDYGIVLDDTTSPVRIGTKKKDVEFQTGAGEDVAFEAGPYKINYWSTTDINKQLNDLAKVGNFDYRLDFSWSGEDVAKFLRLGYPRIGRRLDGRYVVGENIWNTPEIAYRGEDYCTHVVVLGAGDGRKMRRGEAFRLTGGMERTKVFTDKSLDSNAKCRRRAQQLLRRFMGEAHIDQFQVLTNELEADPGDELLFQNTGGWAGAEEVWVRVMEITTNPESPQSLVKVARVEAV